jgi:uncharacterized surface protein with fasciclin (FAS1) repeats
MNTRRKSLIAALAVAVPLSLSACGGSSSTEAAAQSPSASESMSPSMTPSPSDSMTSSAPMDAMNAQFGSGCAAVPKDGKGSFKGMATDPVATAASNNPLLSTLVGAVTSAGLVDTLNSAQDITVFAPVNDAFGKVDPATLKKALADPKGLLTKVLTNHVVPGKLTPADLAGEHKTLGGGTIKVEGSGESFTVDGKATVICGNVTTANATVYIIDGVLLPTS